MYFKINGLILIKKNIKEKSAIIYILTQNLGIIKSRVDGINRSESKLLSVIQPGVFGKFYIVSETSFLKILSFLPFKIPSNIFKKFPYTYLWSLRLLIYFNFLSVSKEFFNKVINLEKYILKNRKSFSIWFLNSIFKELGISPNLTSCNQCNRKLIKKIYYHKFKFYCDKCRRLAYQKLDFNFYQKLLYYYQNDRMLYLKNKELIDFLKKIFKRHLKEINL